jgi:hypothetical protein
MVVQDYLELEAVVVVDTAEPLVLAIVKVALAVRVLLSFVIQYKEKAHEKRKSNAIIQL